MTRGRSIDWTDVLYMPCAIALYLILERWLSNSMAAGISAVLALLVLDILTRQVSDKKGLILSLLTAGLVTYACAAILGYAV